MEELLCWFLMSCWSAAASVFWLGLPWSVVGTWLSSMVCREYLVSWALPCSTVKPSLELELSNTSGEECFGGCFCLWLVG